MRVLQVHNYYQQSGGEDGVVEAERSMLAQNGWEVQQHVVHNDDIVTAFDQLKTAWRLVYSDGAKRALAEQLAARRPDVVHVHNFFPRLTPSVYDACLEAGIPVVQTLHNYRIVCPAALLLRDGAPCEDCLVGSPYQAVVHGCYRGSRAASFATARMVAYHRRKLTWQTKVSRLIALTRFAKSKFVESGIPEHCIAVKPNSVPDSGYTPGGVDRKGALFVGRLSEEKGIAALLAAWRDLDVPLRIAGGGPLEALVAQVEHAAVTVLGRIPPPAVGREMTEAAFLIIPSIWYEGFPMTIVEAFSRGLPVLCSGIGGMAEIVEDGVTGLHFEPGNPVDLAAKVRWAAEHEGEMQRMGKRAREIYEQNYTPDINYRLLNGLYRDVIDGRSRTAARSGKL